MDMFNAKKTFFAFFNNSIIMLFSRWVIVRDNKFNDLYWYFVTFCDGLWDIEQDKRRK
jgi:hypothetical protein